MLGPNEYQMADNLIEEIMMNNFHNNQNSNNNQIFIENEQNHTYEANNSSNNFNQYLNISTQMQNTEFAAELISPNTSNINPSVITPGYNILNQNNPSSIGSFQTAMPSYNNHNNLIQTEKINPQNSDGIKKVRKNLKDILKENSSSNSNTIILNQKDSNSLFMPL